VIFFGRRVGRVHVAGPAAVHERVPDGGESAAEGTVAHLYQPAGLLRAAIGKHRISRQALRVLVRLGQQIAPDIVVSVGHPARRGLLRAVEQQARGLDGVAAEHVAPRRDPQHAVVGALGIKRGHGPIGADFDEIDPRPVQQPGTGGHRLGDMDRGVVFGADRADRHAVLLPQQTGRPSWEASCGRG
jgi:hypothetical protein